jgi:hypothetical protein
MLLAVAITLATPLSSVTAVALERTAEAPRVGDVNVTVMLVAGKPDVSVTAT